MFFLDKKNSIYFFHHIDPISSKNLDIYVYKYIKNNIVTYNNEIADLTCKFLKYYVSI